MAHPAGLPTGVATPGSSVRLMATARASAKFARGAFPSGVFSLDLTSPSWQHFSRSSDARIRLDPPGICTKKRMVETTREGLVRVIRRWDLAAIVLNSIIGAGIFGLPAAVLALVGVYSLFAFLFCAFLVTLIILCFAEVSSRYTQTGGPYLYAREAFGPVVGFEVGWLMWIARLTAFAANCNLLIAYFGFFIPSLERGVSRAAAITIVVTVLTAINIIGVRDATILTNALTIAKLLPLVLFVVVGLFFIDSGRYALTAPPALGDFSVSVLLLVYAFTGFEMAAIPGGEARDPRRDLPWALLTAIAVVTVFYLLIQLIAIGTLPELAGSTRPLADAGGRFLGSLGAAIISAGALVSILGNLNVTLMESVPILVEN